MTRLSKVIIFLIVVVTAGLLAWRFWPAEEAVEENGTEQTHTQTPEECAECERLADLIQVDEPLPGAAVSSPLAVRGQARGYWFFEASFPVVLTDWDGLIIAEGIATAQGDWMTEDFVPFTAELEFDSPYTAGDPEFMNWGNLILRKDNPSGLPEQEEALEFRVKFGE